MARGASARPVRAEPVWPQPVWVAGLALLVTALLAGCGGSSPAEGTDPFDAKERATQVEPEIAAPSGPPQTAGAATLAAYEALSGDARAGRRVFSRCTSCHVVRPGLNGVGPSLHGVIDRQSAAVPGFNYSRALRGANILWTEATLYEYLENPRRYVPGTTMSFAGLPKPQDRADVIAYIREESAK
ncbi:MAG: cytochrome c family protein [Pseudomonadota bacterium]